MIKFLKRVILFLCIIFLSLVIYNIARGRLYRGFEAQKIGNQIFEYLKNEDVDGLKSLFSEYVSKQYDLDKELAEFYELIDGDIVAYEDFSASSSSESIRDGKQVHLSYVASFDNVKTDTGKCYKVIFFIYFRHENGQDKEGVSSLRLVTEDRSIVYYVGEK